MSEFRPEIAFMDLCEKGQLQEIKKLLTVYSETDILLGNNYGLISAVKKDHVPVVKYLLERTKLGQEPSIYKEQSAYLVACDQGKIECIELFFKNWLNHKEQQESNPEIWEYGFSSAYVNENAKTIKLFLENPIMKPYANIHLENDNCFIHLYKIERKDLLDSLILDYNIEMTDSIKSFLDSPDRIKDKFGNEYTIDKSELKDMFEKRDFKNKLQNLLPEKESKVRTNKI